MSTLLDSFSSYALDSLARTLLSWLGTSIALGTLAAAIAWLLTRTLLRRARPAVHAAIWLVVLVRFVMPDGPDWSLSLASLTRGWMPAVGHASAAGGANDGGPATGGLPEATILVRAAGQSAVNESADAYTPVVTATAWPSLLTLLAAAYVGVVALFAALRTVRYARFAAHCRSLPPAGEAVERLVARTGRRCGLPVPPRIRVSHECSTPFIFGALRPTLVLPAGMLADEDELETVVLHELAHFRRGDLLARGLQCLAGTLLFFWPVVAWVNRRLDLAREQACDEWALRHGRLTAGQYARCLLKAAQPLGLRYAAIRPAAMAANASHVERRIEMIMDAKLTGRQSRMMRLTAGTLVLGWGGFVLSGAAASNGAAKSAEDVSAKPKMMVVEAIGGPGEEDVVVFTPGLWAGGAAMGDVQMLLECGETDGVATQNVAIAVQSGPSDEALASFLTAHPTADADGNGSLSRSEYQAYVVALAVNSPQPVIARFPKADLDGDGALSASEAARLVAGGGFPHFAAPLKAGRFVVRSNAAHADAAAGEVTVAVECEDGEAVPGAKVIKLRRAGAPDGAAEPKVRVIRRTKDADGNVTEVEESGDPVTAPQAIAVAGVPAGVGMFGRALPVPPPSMPAKWIAENVTGSPTAAQVAGYVKLVEEMPLALFLEHNPEADANKDGKLTPEERAEFVKNQMSRMHQKLLERHPEADANGDGVLTPEEAREFFHAKARSMAPGINVIKSNATSGDEIEVEVITEDSPK